MSIDKKIDQQMICNRCGTKNEHLPLCNAMYCPPASLAREVMDLFYLKPDQFNLLFNGPFKLVIEGPAGTGKTIVILLKIIYLVRSDTEYNIILFAPYPHNIRCKHFLEKNGVQVLMEETFPLQPLGDAGRGNLIAPIVRIVDLQMFNINVFVDMECYDSAGENEMVNFHEHVFVDDMQAMDFSKIRKNYEKPFQILSQLCNFNDKMIHLWLAFDPAQHDGYVGQLRHALCDMFEGVTTYELTYVLRNSRPILRVVDAEYSSEFVSIRKDGHSINGPTVDIYVLTNSLNPTRKAFYQQQYLKKELDSIFKKWHDVPTAIVCHKTSVDNLCSSILKDLEKETCSIKDYIEQGNILNPSQVVLDSMDCVPSFEMPFIIAVTETVFTTLLYVLSSRARTKLVLLILDGDANSIQEMKKKHPDAHFVITDSSNLPDTELYCESQNTKIDHENVSSIEPFVTGTFVPVISPGGPKGDSLLLE